MHITTEVHLPSSLCPPLGIVTDWDTGITMIFYHTEDTWNIVGVVKTGHTDAVPVPDCFSVDPQIVSHLNTRLSESHAHAPREADLTDLVIRRTA